MYRKSASLILCAVAMALTVPLASASSPETRADIGGASGCAILGGGASGIMAFTAAMKRVGSPSIAAGIAALGVVSCGTGYFIGSTVASKAKAGPDSDENPKVSGSLSKAFEGLALEVPAVDKKTSEASEAR